ATGLWADRIFPSAPSDAAWFVAAVDGGLRAADWQRPARECLRQAASATKRRFHNEAASPPADMSSWPSGAVTILNVQMGGVELVNLGDCRLLFRSANRGPIRSFGTSAVAALDGRLVNEIVRLQVDGVVEPAAIWARLVPHIRANRARMNTEGGYWVLDVAGRGLDHVDEEVVAPGEIGGVLLVTCGVFLCSRDFLWG